MIWACPICKAPLRLGEGGVHCPRNHQFDRAKQGYLPLLPAHHRRSAAPGDDKAMLSGRRAFLQAGHYQPLVDRLAKELQELSAQRGSSLTLLDSGCGEGYYLQQLLVAAEAWSSGLDAYGIDISKEATKLSARALPEASIAVASSFQLPVLDDCVDVLLRIFSPGDSGEVARVLSSSGEFWRVVPGPEHLFQLKQALYDEATVHQLPSVPEGFELISEAPIEFSMSLEGSEAIGQLLQMTPFVWRGSETGKGELRRAVSLAVSASFVLQRYRSA